MSATSGGPSMTSSGISRSNQPVRSTAHGDEPTLESRRCVTSTADVALVGESVAVKIMPPNRRRGARREWYYMSATGWSASVATLRPVPLHLLEGCTMSRDDGFAVMDVSTDIINDPKVRKLWRYAPSHAAVALVGYVATMAESWKAGRRVSIDDAWPAIVPFNQSAVEALAHVGLLDKRGMVTVAAWRGWYEPAKARRDKSRDRWARYNAQRNADTASLPRGTNADTASSVPSVPSVRPSLPTKQGVDVVQRASLTPRGVLDS